MAEEQADEPSKVAALCYRWEYTTKSRDYDRDRVSKVDHALSLSDCQRIEDFFMNGSRGLIYGFVRSYSQRAVPADVINAIFPFLDTSKCQLSGASAMQTPNNVYLTDACPEGYQRLNRVTRFKGKVLDESGTIGFYYRHCRQPSELRERLKSNGCYFSPNSRSISLFRTEHKVFVSFKIGRVAGQAMAFDVSCVKTYGTDFTAQRNEVGRQCQISFRYPGPWR